MKTVRFTPSAKAHLVDIWTFSAQTWGEARADRYLRRIDESIAAAAAGHRALVSRPEVGEGLRSMLCGSHVIFLLEGDELVVVGVLHQSMDVAAHLTSET